MIPLLHDFDGACVLVFGGGPVGARKARRFAHEADVTVLAPDFADVDFGEATCERAEPDPDAVDAWLEEYSPALVVAATDDAAVNAAVETAGSERGILVNRADRAENRDPGSVVLPAITRADPVVVAVSTQGAAPAVSAALRDEIDSFLENAGTLAAVLATLRRSLADADVPAARRRDVLRTLARSTRFREPLDDACSVTDAGDGIQSRPATSDRSS
ncbi:MAG: bifunctional precorrin-2 dehydrogenase/sirohydrochlorin ferrochelatase [Halorhabdus sp.]